MRDPNTVLKYVPTSHSDTFPAMRCEAAPLSSLAPNLDKAPETVGNIANRSWKDPLKGP
jgi:hypothetical protein